jgi:hypothetical protein
MKMVKGKTMHPQLKNRLSMGKVHYVGHESKRVFCRMWDCGSMGHKTWEKGKWNIWVSCIHILRNKLSIKGKRCILEDVEIKVQIEG